MGGAAVATSVVLSACKSNNNNEIIPADVIDGQGEMTYRVNPNSGDKVSLLGYGMMRLPIEGGADLRQNPDAQVDQEMVNEEIDYALEHGVNYFDTAPVYTRGRSEGVTGIALSRHPRNSYYIATKLSSSVMLSRKAFAVSFAFSASSPFSKVIMRYTTLSNVAGYFV